MKLHFLGTSSGNHPLPDRRHQSFVIEINGDLYWFDAGACCSITAHLMGLDLLAVKKVIISHPHMDHVGGLGNLFWDIRKLKSVKNRDTKFKSIDLYIPEMKTWEGFFKVLVNAQDNFSDMTIDAHQVIDGVIFEDENMKVTAFHNLHMGSPLDGVWKSFSYLIEAQGKKIVFSGDVKSLDELDKLIGCGCDIALVETGHHHYMNVAKHLNGKGVKNLFYTHNGENLFSDPIKALIDVQNIFDGNVLVCSDKTSFSF